MADSGGSPDGYLKSASLVLILVALFYLSNFLTARAVTRFPAPGLAFRGKIVFDIARVKNPTLLSLAVSPKRRVGMLDSKSGIAQIFSPAGQLLCQTLAELPGGGKLQHPLCLAFGENEEIFLADTGNQRIVQFSPDGAIKVLGKPGIFNGQFVLPTSLVCFEGNIFILDSALCRIQQFSAGGNFVAKTGRKGDFPGSFLLPTSIALDSGSNFLILDSRNSTISQYDFLLNFNSRKKITASQKGFAPTRIAFAGDGLSFCLSKESQEIAVFFQNMAVDILSPKKLGLDSAFWTDIAGRENFIYLLDGKNMKTDIFEIR